MTNIDTHTRTQTITPLHTIGLFAISLAASLTPFPPPPHHFLFPFWNTNDILSLVTCRMFTLRPPPKKVLLLNSSKWVSRQLPTVGRVCFSSRTTPHLRPHASQGDPHPVTEWGITAVLFQPPVRRSWAALTPERPVWLAGALLGLHHSSGSSSAKFSFFLLPFTDIDP